MGMSESFSGNSAQKDCPNTVKHQSGSVDLVVANHRGNGGNLVTITTLVIMKFVQVTVYNYEGKEFTDSRTVVYLP